MEWDTVVEWKDYKAWLHEKAESLLPRLVRPHLAKGDLKPLVNTVDALDRAIQSCRAKQDWENMYIFLVRLTTLYLQYLSPSKHWQVLPLPDRNNTIRKATAAVAAAESLSEKELRDVFMKTMETARQRQQEREQREREREAEREAQRKREEQQEQQRLQREMQIRIQEERERQEAAERRKQLALAEQQANDDVERQRLRLLQQQEAAWQQQQEDARRRREDAQRQAEERQRRLFWRFVDDAPPPGAQRQSRRGLVNLGNTCYMNSVLQALFATPLARKFLENTEEMEQDINVTNPLGFSGRVAGVFNHVMIQMTKELAFPIQPREFKAIISQFNATFEGYSQQDSEEFCRVLLDGIHEDLNRVKRRVPLTDAPKSFPTDEQNAAEAWQRYRKNNDSVVVDMFAFLEKSTVRCTSCGHESLTFSPATSLAVPIPENVEITELRDCLGMYQREETLDSPWKCGRCLQQVAARKRLQVYSAPSVLVLSLKRFKAFHNFADKITKDVHFPLQLDMTEWLPVSDFTTTYQLVAVVNHEGGMGGGHYTADVRGYRDGKWCNFSDERVMPSESPRLKQAYLLMYVRQPQRRKPPVPKPAPRELTPPAEPVPAPTATLTSEAPKPSEQPAQEPPPQSPQVRNGQGNGIYPRQSEPIDPTHLAMLAELELLEQKKQRQMAILEAQRRQQMQAAAAVPVAPSFPAMQDFSQWPSPVQQPPPVNNFGYSAVAQPYSPSYPPPMGAPMQSPQNNVLRSVYAQQPTQAPQQPIDLIFFGDLETSPQAIGQKAAELSKQVLQLRLRAQLAHGSARDEVKREVDTLSHQLMQLIVKLDQAGGDLAHRQQMKSSIEETFRQVDTIRLSLSGL